MHYADYKTILSPNNGMNIYRGCTHGCIYCDSRSKCYRFEHDFEDIEVKRNAPQILESQLKGRRNKCMVGTGSMCDPYIHLEEELEITRQCLSVIERNGFGVSVLTKSSRILRDIDILKRINGRTKCVVQTTLTTYDEDLCKKIEPNVSSTQERLRVLMRMKEEGIPTVVWLCPILPFINDTEENLKGLLGYCTEADVKGILCFGFGVTLREGDREYFYENLDRSFPGVKERYIEAYGEKYQCNSRNSVRLTEIFRETCKEHNILYRTDDVFGYLNRFESKSRQSSLPGIL